MLLTIMVPALSYLGHAIWTSEESVQQWINTIEQRSNETSEPSSPTKSSFDSDVFLQLPGGGKNVIDLFFCQAFLKVPHFDPVGGGHGFAS